MAKERLQKYIANCGYCSRRKAELLIEAGLVRVDGTVVGELGVKIDPAKNEVRIHDEVIVPHGREVIALHKPAGFITSTHDTHERLTVMDLLPRRVAETGVLPAGRLDLETEGLLILTNDGDLQHRITHPRYECTKEYYVELDRRPTEGELDRLRRGIFLPDLDRTTSPAELFDVRHRPDGTTLRIRIAEGMKRQIRRMFEAVGMTVVYLKRLSIGDVHLGDLPRGEWRALTVAEVASLDASGDASTGRSAGTIDRPRAGEKPPSQERARNRDMRGAAGARRSGPGGDTRPGNPREGESRRSGDRPNRGGPNRGGTGREGNSRGGNSRGGRKAGGGSGRGRSRS